MRLLDPWADDLLELLRLPVALLSLAAVAVLLAPLWWMAELVSHFAVQLLLASLACLLLLLAARRRAGRGLLGLACVTALIFTDPVVRAHAPAPDTDTDTDASLRLLHFNVLTSNPDKARAVEEITRVAPDLIVAQEIDRAWLDALTTGLPNHRVLAATARSDNFGMAVLAHARLVEAEAEVHDDAWGQGMPTIEIALPGLRLLAVHTLPPISAAYARRRDAQLAGAAAWSQTNADHARAVVGDLNVSVYSPRFRALQADAALIDGRRSAGVFARRTFPAGPLGLLLGIPIDHVLHSQQLRVDSFEVADDWGSDHRAVIATLRYATRLRESPSSPSSARPSASPPAGP